MEIIETKYSKKLDSVGRLVIPIRLREQLGLNSDTIYSFKIIKDDNARYLAIECPETQSEIDLAKQLLERNGMKVITID